MSAFIIGGYGHHVVMCHECTEKHGRTVAGGEPFAHYGAAMRARDAHNAEHHPPRVTVTLSPAAAQYVRDLVSVDDLENAPAILTADDLEAFGYDPGLRF